MGVVLEVNSEGTAVRRSTDNPPPDIFSAEQRKRMKEKTVYVVRVLSVCVCVLGGASSRDEGYGLKGNLYFLLEWQH